MGMGRWSTSKDRLSQHIFLIPKISVNRITLQSQKALRELFTCSSLFLGPDVKWSDKKSARETRIKKVTGLT